MGGSWGMCTPLGGIQMYGGTQMYRGVQTWGVQPPPKYKNMPTTKK